MAKPKYGIRPRSGRERTAQTRAKHHLYLSSATITVHASWGYQPDAVWEQYEWPTITKKQLGAFSKAADKATPRPTRKLDLDDWADATGEINCTLSRSELIALEAWRFDSTPKFTFRAGKRYQVPTHPWAYQGELPPNPFKHLEPKRKPRRGPPVDRTGEPWNARVGEQILGEHYWDREEMLGVLDVARWYRAITASLSGSRAWEESARSFLGKGWGRTTREVLFKDGKRRQVIAVKAKGKARPIAVTSELNLLYRGSLVWEHQRNRWRVFHTEPRRSVAYCKAPLGGPARVPDLFAFAHVRWWPSTYRSDKDAPPPWRPPICFALDPEKGDWKHRPDPDNSGVERRRRVPEWIFEVRKTGWVEKEGAEDAADDHDVDDRPLDLPIDGNPVVLEVFHDGSFAVHRINEPRNHARMRGSIPRVSTARAFFGFYGYRQPKIGDRRYSVSFDPRWAARPPIPNADVALTVLRSGELPPVEQVHAYWRNRLGKTRQPFWFEAGTYECRLSEANRNMCHRLAALAVELGCELNPKRLAGKPHPKTSFKYLARVAVPPAPARAFAHRLAA
jgi:hypothetical protein